MTGAARGRCRHRSWLALWRGCRWRGRLWRRRRALGCRAGVGCRHAGRHGHPGGRGSWRARVARGRRGAGLRRRLELAARHARQQRQGLAPVEVLLLIHHVVVLEVRLERRLRRIAQDLRADEQDEVVLGRSGVARLEQQPDERNVAEVRHALLTLDAVVLDEATEHHHAAFSSASWLSMVTAEGVATTLVLVSPRMARTMAAKFTPVPATRPMPMVVPCSSAVEALAGFWMAPARSTMLVPPTGLTKAPAG